MADTSHRPRSSFVARPYNERLAHHELSQRAREQGALLSLLSERAEEERAKEEARARALALSRKRRTATLDVDALVEASRKIMRGDTSETLEQLAERVAVDPSDKPAVIMVLANLKWSRSRQ